MRAAGLGFRRVAAVSVAVVLLAGSMDGPAAAGRHGFAPVNGIKHSGYDPQTLAGDIRAFMDAIGIVRATLIGFSVAGSEMTRFATLYPERVDRLVYLDAADDYKSGYELATNPRTRYPLPLPDPPGPLGTIVRATREADPDYTGIRAPALACFTIYDSPYVPADADADLRARIVKRWEDFGNPFQRHRIDHFRRDMKNGRIIELRHVDHGDFVRDETFQAYLTNEIRLFLTSPVV